MALLSSSIDCVNHLTESPALKQSMDTTPPKVSPSMVSNNPAQMSMSKLGQSVTQVFLLPRASRRTNKMSTPLLASPIQLTSITIFHFDGHPVDDHVFCAW